MAEQIQDVSVARAAFHDARGRQLIGLQSVELLPRFPYAALKLFECVPFNLDTDGLLIVETDGRLTVVQESAQWDPSFVFFGGGRSVFRDYSREEAEDFYELFTHSRPESHSKSSTREFDPTALRRVYLPVLKPFVEKSKGPREVWQGDDLQRTPRLLRQTPEDTRYFPLLFTSQQSPMYLEVHPAAFHPVPYLKEVRKGTRAFDVTIPKAALLCSRNLPSGALAAFAHTVPIKGLTREDHGAFPGKGSAFCVQKGDKKEKRDRTEKKENDNKKPRVGTIRTRMTWLEACWQLLCQAQATIQAYFALKGLSFISLEKNFRISFGTLTTAQRKRSRVGHSLSLLLELLELLHGLYCILQKTYRRHNREEIARELHGFYTELPWRTGLYRFKYRLSRNLGLIRHLRTATPFYPALLAEYIRNSPRPAAGIFQGALRGLCPLCQQYLQKALLRIANLRPQQLSDATKKITKQRKTAYNDLILRQTLARECLDAMGAPVTPANLSTVFLHFREALRLRKAKGIEYSQIQNQRALGIVNRYVDEKLQRAHRDFLETRTALYFGTKRLQKNEIKHSFEQIPRLFLLELQRLDTAALEHTDRQMMRDLLAAAQFLQKELRIPRLGLEDALEQSRGTVIRTLQVALEQQVKLLDAQQEDAAGFKLLLFKAQQEPDQLLEELLVELRAPPAYTRIHFHDRYHGVEIQLLWDAREFALCVLLSALIRPPLLGLWHCSAGLAGLEAVGVQGAVRSFLEKNAQIESEQEAKPGISSFRWAQTPAPFMEASAHFALCPLGFVQKIAEVFFGPEMAQVLLARLRGKLVFKDVELSPRACILEQSPLFQPVAQTLWAAWDAMRFGVTTVCEPRRAGRLFLEARWRGETVLFRRLGAEEYWVLPVSCAAESGGWKWGAESRVLELCDARLFQRCANREFNSRNALLSVPVGPEERALLAGSGDIVYMAGVCFEQVIEYNGFRIRLDGGRKCAGVVESSAARWLACQELLRLVIQPPLQFSRIAQRFNLGALRFLSHFREFSSRNALEMFRSMQEKTRRCIQARFHSLDRRRIAPEMLYLCEQLGGLGVFWLGGTEGEERGRNPTGNEPRVGSEDTLRPIQEYLTPWAQIATQAASAAPEIHIGRRDLERIELPQYTAPAGGVFWGASEQPAGLYIAPRDGTCYLAPGAEHSRLKMGHFLALQSYQKDVLAHFLAKSSSVLGGTLLWAALPPQEPCGKETEMDVLLGLNQSMRLFEQPAVLNKSRLTKAQRQGLSQVPNRRFVAFWSPRLNRSDVFLGKAYRVPGSGIYMRGKLPTLGQFYASAFGGGLWRAIHRGLVQDVFSILERHREELGLTEIQALPQHAEKAEGVYEHFAPGAEVAADLWVKCPAGGRENTALYHREITACTADTIADAVGPEPTAAEAQTYLDIKIIWADFDLFEKESFLAHCRRDYFADYSHNETRPLRMYVDLVYQRQCLVGPLERTGRIASFLGKALPKVAMHSRPCQQLRIRLQNLLQVYAGTPEEAVITEDNFHQLLKHESLIFHQHDTRDERLGQMHRALYFLSPQRMEVRGRVFSLPISQKNKAERLQNLTGEYLYELLTQHQKQAKILACTQPHLLELLRRVVQINNLPQRVSLSRAEFCLDRIASDVLQAKDPAQVHLQLGPSANKSSADTFVRAVSLLRAAESAGPRWLSSTLGRILPSELPALGSYFIATAKKAPKGTAQTQDVSWLDRQIETALVEAHTARFGPVSVHLLNQRAIIKLALGGTLDPEDFAQKAPVSMEFQLRKDTELHVHGASTKHFAGMTAAKVGLRSGLASLAAGPQPWEGIGLGVSFQEIQAQADADVMERARILQAEMPPPHQSDEFELIAVLPRSLIPQLRQSLPLEGVYYLYGVEGEEGCLEIRQVALDNAEVKSGHLRNLGSLLVGNYTLKEQPSGPLRLKTDWRVSELQGNASVVFTSLFLGELRDWEDQLAGNGQ